MGPSKDMTIICNDNAILDNKDIDVSSMSNENIYRYLYSLKISKLVTAKAAHIVVM